MLVKGDKLVVINNVNNWLKEGDIVEVVEANENMISFAFGNNFIHKGVMSKDEYEKHFKKYEEPKKVRTTVTEEEIDEILVNSKITITTMFDKCTIVACRLSNGFVIVESSACVSPENYDEEIGIDICMGRIKNKLWELEGYRLQEELYQSNKNNNENCTEEDDDWLLK